ncbi:MAG: DUF5688 family protein [Lachnospiraceae bacterium]|nr:DUF5688 family protein [Lachnospiraceae bacterium]
MTYENFIEELLADLTLRFPEKTEFQVKRILKNNGLSMDGLLITDPSINISPTIYLPQYYEEYIDGKSISNICDGLVACYERHKVSQSIDISFFTDFSQVRDNIIFKLIHTESNQELLMDVPHITYYDLSIVFCYYLPANTCQVTSEETNATILIRNEHLIHWDETAESLFILAKKNSPRLFPPQLQRLPELLTDIWGELPEDNISMEEVSEQIPLFVLTNQSRFFGAGVLLYDNILEQCAKKLGSRFYVIPSSIHEVLLLPFSQDIHEEDLNEMVQEVNCHHVAIDEVLSDHVYLYDVERRAFIS